MCACAVRVRILGKHLYVSVYLYLFFSCSFHTLSCLRGKDTKKNNRFWEFAQLRINLKFLGPVLGRLVGGRQQAVTFGKYSVSIANYSVTIANYSVSIFRKALPNSTPLQGWHKPPTNFRFILSLDFWGNERKYFVSLQPNHRRMENMTHLTHLTELTNYLRNPHGYCARTYGTREKLIINVSNPSNPSIMRQIRGELLRFVANSFVWRNKQERKSRKSLEWADFRRNFAMSKGTKPQDKRIIKHLNNNSINN